MLSFLIADIFNWQGLLLGFGAFIMIGVFHPVVTKMEYFLGRESWFMLFFPGLGFLIGSFFLGPVLSIVAGCLAFSMFWSTLEIFLQHQRVLKGRAKKNPKRNYNA